MFNKYSIALGVLLVSTAALLSSAQAGKRPAELFNNENSVNIRWIPQAPIKSQNLKMRWVRKAAKHPHLYLMDGNTLYFAQKPVTPLAPLELEALRREEAATNNGIPRPLLRPRQ